MKEIMFDINGDGVLTEHKEPFCTLEIEDANTWSRLKDAMDRASVVAPLVRNGVSYCSNCNKPLNDEGCFCSYCGQKYKKSE